MHRRFLHEPGRFLREPAEWTLRGLTVLGIVANPKTNEPALVVTDGDYVSLRSLSAEDLLRRLGRGYFDDDNTTPYEITGMPRCHTPDGVEEKGRGWGTSLYTALSTAAYLHDTYEAVVISMHGRGEGCSSWTANRSGDADHWWAAAVRLGLAEQVEGEGETEKEEDVEIDVPADDLDKYIDEGTVVYVNKVSVDIEKTVEQTAERYPYANATGKHLVGAEMAVVVPKELVDRISAGEKTAGSLEILGRAIEESEDLIFAADPVALAAFDVRALGREAMNLLSLCAAIGGVDDGVISEMWRRNERGLDPVLTSGGRRLAARDGGGMASVIDAREEAGWAELAMLP